MNDVLDFQPLASSIPSVLIYIYSIYIKIQLYIQYILLYITTIKFLLSRMEIMQI